MLSEFKSQLTAHLEETLKSQFPKKTEIPTIELETPAEKIHGEFSCNVALKSAKLLKKSPLDLAEEFLKEIEESLEGASFKNQIHKVEVRKPGFINFFLTPEALHDILADVFKRGDDFGRMEFGKKQNWQIEFVSANPTGPLSVAHARQAAVGDALANILEFLGFKMTREFYVNDEGNQINMLGESLKCRAIELLGGRAELPEDGYKGEYIKAMAEDFLQDNDIEHISFLEQREKDLSEYGARHLLGVIKIELNDFGVHFDVWSLQSKIATQKNLEAMLDYLGEKGFLYEKDGALWFKSTDFGDDKDRVVEKSDNSYTYLTPDIVYHKDKYDRGFDKLINIWGPDHHGYIPRIKAAVEALGQDRESLEILIVQLATISRGGKPLSMSTRKGQYITLREVIDEVGVDAARFFFLMRHIKAHLEFDLELAKKETPENPVYYIQYAHARVHSMNKKANELSIKPNLKDFSLLIEAEELDLIKKLGMLPDSLIFCYNQLDPCPLTTYLHELATTFHKFYDVHRVVDENNKDLSAQRLALVNATRIVLANGLRLLGLSTPESM